MPPYQKQASLNAQLKEATHTENIHKTQTSTLLSLETMEMTLKSTKNET